jgi:hypothetical protein
MFCLKNVALFTSSICPLDWVAVLSLCSEFLNSPHLILNTTEGSSHHVKSSDIMDIPSYCWCLQQATYKNYCWRFIFTIIFPSSSDTSNVSFPSIIFIGSALQILHHYHGIHIPEMINLFSGDPRHPFLFYTLIPIADADKCLHDLITPSLSGWRISVQLWGKTTFTFFRKLVSWGWAAHWSMKTKIFLLRTHFII